ncbi:MAG: DUF4442 domain-containing protein [Pseudomonadota bacterium]
MKNIVHAWLMRVLPLSQARRLEWFPMFAFLRVKVLELQPDWRVVRLRLPLSARSQNPGGTMFGGAPAAVADPIAGLACARAFPDYIVWTKSLQVEFLHPGTDALEMVFRFEPEQRARIEEELAQRQKSDPVFEYGFYDRAGRLCVRVRNTVAVRPDGYRGFRGAVRR